MPGLKCRVFAFALASMVCGGGCTSQEELDPADFHDEGDGSMDLGLFDYGEFRELESGAEVSLVAGLQGAHHIDLAVSVASDTPMDSTVEVSLRRAHDNYDVTVQSFSLEDAFEDHVLPVQVLISDRDAVLEQLIVVDVELVDADVAAVQIPLFVLEDDPRPGV